MSVYTDPSFYFFWIHRFFISGNPNTFVFGTYQCHRILQINLFNVRTFQQSSILKDTKKSN